MRMTPPADLERALAAQWRFTLSRVQEEMDHRGRNSTEYGVAIAVSLTFATAIMCAYGFTGDRALSETQAYLNALLDKYPAGVIYHAS